VARWREAKTTQPYLCPAKEGSVLVLSRKVNQAIMIGDDVRIVIVAVDRDQVKLGVEAPREISVHRSEIYEEIKRSGHLSAEERKLKPSGRKRGQ
jgi:carbon storage regulator